MTGIRGSGRDPKLDLKSATEYQIVEDFSEILQIANKNVIPLHCFVSTYNDWCRDFQKYFNKLFEMRQNLPALISPHLFFRVFVTFLVSTLLVETVRCKHLGYGTTAISVCIFLLILSLVTAIYVYFSMIKNASDVKCAPSMNVLSKELMYRLNCTRRKFRIIAGPNLLSMVSDYDDNMSKYTDFLRLWLCGFTSWYSSFGIICALPIHVILSVFQLEVHTEISNGFAFAIVPILSFIQYKKVKESQEKITQIFCVLKLKKEDFWYWFQDNCRLKNLLEKSKGFNENILKLFVEDKSSSLLLKAQELDSLQSSLRLVYIVVFVAFGLQYTMRASNLNDTILFLLFNKPNLEEKDNREKPTETTQTKTETAHFVKTYSFPVYHPKDRKVLNNSKLETVKNSESCKQISKPDIIEEHVQKVTEDKVLVTFKDFLHYTKLSDIQSCRDSSVQNQSEMETYPRNTDSACLEDDKLQSFSMDSLDLTDGNTEVTQTTDHSVNSEFTADKPTCFWKNRTNIECQRKLENNTMDQTVADTGVTTENTTSAKKEKYYENSALSDLLEVDVSKLIHQSLADSDITYDHIGQKHLNKIPPFSEQENELIEEMKGVTIQRDDKNQNITETSFKIIPGDSKALKKGQTMIKELNSFTINRHLDVQDKSAHMGWDVKSSDEKENSKPSKKYTLEGNAADTFDDFEDEYIQGTVFDALATTAPLNNHDQKPVSFLNSLYKYKSSNKDLQTSFPISHSERSNLPEKEDSIQIRNSALPVRNNESESYNMSNTMPSADNDAVFPNHSFEEVVSSFEFPFINTRDLIKSLFTPVNSYAEVFHALPKRNKSSVSMETVERDRFTNDMESCSVERSIAQSQNLRHHHLTSKFDLKNIPEKNIINISESGCVSEISVPSSLSNEDILSRILEPTDLNEGTFQEVSCSNVSHFDSQRMDIDMDTLTENWETILTISEDHEKVNDCHSTVRQCLDATTMNEGWNENEIIIPVSMYGRSDKTESKKHDSTMEEFSSNSGCKQLSGKLIATLEDPNNFNEENKQVFEFGMREIGAENKFNFTPESGWNVKLDGMWNAHAKEATENHGSGEILPVKSTPKTIYISKRKHLKKRFQGNENPWMRKKSEIRIPESTKSPCEKDDIILKDFDDVSTSVSLPRVVEANNISYNNLKNHNFHFCSDNAGIERDYSLLIPVPKESHLFSTLSTPSYQASKTTEPLIRDDKVDKNDSYPSFLSLKTCSWSGNIETNNSSAMFFNNYPGGMVMPNKTFQLEPCQNIPEKIFNCGVVGEAGTDFVENDKDVVSCPGSEDDKSENSVVQKLAIQQSISEETGKESTFDSGYWLKHETVFDSPEHERKYPTESYQVLRNCGNPKKKGILNKMNFSENEEIDENVAGKQLKHRSHETIQLMSHCMRVRKTRDLVLFGRGKGIADRITRKKIYKTETDRDHADDQDIKNEVKSEDILSDDRKLSNNSDRDVPNSIPTVDNEFPGVFGSSSSNLIQSGSGNGDVVPNSIPTVDNEFPGVFWSSSPNLIQSGSGNGDAVPNSIPTVDNEFPGVFGSSSPNLIQSGSGNGDVVPNSIPTVDNEFPGVFGSSSPNLIQSGSGNGDVVPNSIPTVDNEFPGVFGSSVPNLTPSFSHRLVNTRKASRLYSSSIKNRIKKHTASKNKTRKYMGKSRVTRTCESNLTNDYIKNPGAYGKSDQEYFPDEDTSASSTDSDSTFGPNTTEWNSGDPCISMKSERDEMYGQSKEAERKIIFRNKNPLLTSPEQSPGSHTLSSDDSENQDQEGARNDYRATNKKKRPLWSSNLCVNEMSLNFHAKHKEQKGYHSEETSPVFTELLCEQAELRQMEVQRKSISYSDFSTVQDPSPYEKLVTNSQFKLPSNDNEDCDNSNAEKETPTPEEKYFLQGRNSQSCPKLNSPSSALASLSQVENSGQLSTINQIIGGISGTSQSETQIIQRKNHLPEKTRSHSTEKSCRSFREQENNRDSHYKRSDMYSDEFETEEKPDEPCTYQLRCGNINLEFSDASDITLKFVRKGANTSAREQPKQVKHILDAHQIDQTDSGTNTTAEGAAMHTERVQTFSSSFALRAPDSGACSADTLDYSHFNGTAINRICPMDESSDDEIFPRIQSTASTVEEVSSITSFDTESDAFSETETEMSSGMSLVEELTNKLDCWNDTEDFHFETGDIKLDFLPTTVPGNFQIKYRRSHAHNRLTAESGDKKLFLKTKRY